MFRTKVKFWRWGVISTSPKPKIREQSHVVCPRLFFFQYIRSYPLRMTAWCSFISWWQESTYRGRALVKVVI